MSEAPRYMPHYTVEDYQHWDENWELIEGVAIAMSPSPFAHHERICSRLTGQLRVMIENRECPCELYLNLDWVVSNDTVLRPDLMAVCGDQPEKHLHQPPVLAVEVLSPSTRLRDLNLKMRICREQGVPHYLVIDPESRVIKHCVPDGQTDYDSGKVIQLDLNGFCQVEIDTAKLFDRREA